MKKDVAKRTPIDGISLEEIIENGGYYDLYGQWNSIVTLPKYPGKIFRARVEVFILNDDGQVYMELLGNSKYRIPGGSIDKDLSNINQVYMEAKEEAKILIKDIKFTGIRYPIIFNNKYNDPNMKVVWDGIYNEVYTAQYDRKYNGTIDDNLSDKSMYKYGKFYNIEEIYPFLTEVHRQIFNYHDIHLEGDIGDNEIDMTFRNCANFIRNELSKFLIDRNTDLYLKCNRFFHANQAIMQKDDKLIFGYYDPHNTPNDSIILLVNYLNSVVENSNNFNKIKCFCDEGSIYCIYDYSVSICKESMYDQEYDDIKSREAAKDARDEIQDIILGSINHNMDKFIRLKELKVRDNEISIGQYDSDYLQRDNIKTITTKVNAMLQDNGYSNSIEFKDDVIYLR